MLIHIHTYTYTYTYTYTHTYTCTHTCTYAEEKRLVPPPQPPFEPTVHIDKNALPRISDMFR